MSAATDTLAGLLIINDRNLSATEATDLLQDAPVVMKMNAQPASQGGTLHKFLRELTAPGVGFRAVGQGLTNAAGTVEAVTVTCELLDASFSRDIALALGYKDGQTAYMDKESAKAVRRAFFAVEQSIFASTISQQFTGLLGSGYTDQNADDQVVNAGGSGGKSVWVMRSAEDGVSLIAGNEGRMTMSQEDATIQLYAGAGKGYYTALHRAILGYFGLQIGSKYDVVRIANLDATTGHTLTDAHLAEAVAKFPASKQPNMIVMNRTAIVELQASRTAVNPTGQEAPFPTSAFGFPIVVSDALPSNETVVNSTTTGTTTVTTTSA